jgi:hypothetical protein
VRLALLAILAIAGLGVPTLPAQAQDVVASEPVDLSVTVYRSPYRDEGGFDLDSLEGFALITETRRVVLPPGEHRIRFEGVADGIEPASAIVTGLPSGVIEKNRDAALLSPSALVAAAQTRGGRVQLVRTHPLTGATTRTQGVIRSGAQGVIFESTEGFEALRCTGMAETFGFESAGTGLSAKPTLSVFTRTAEPIDAIVQLSYLAWGFDWAADYVVDMKQGASKLDLGAWVTLANGNGTGFSNARVQIVAGRLNKETEEIEPIDIGQPIMAYCWPQGTTSDRSPPYRIDRAYPLGLDPESDYYDGSDRVVVTGSRRFEDIQESARALTVIQEELGDLKLYRVPDRTTVASRQSKQVRLMDRAGVPVKKIYEADLFANETIDFEPMTILLRTRNDKKNNLGLPLPSGRVSVFETAGRGAAAQRLLSAEGGLGDTALDQETELRLTESPDVQVKQTVELVEVTSAPRPLLPFLPGIVVREIGSLERMVSIEITNARPFAIQAEVRLDLEDGQQVVKADRPVAQKNGRPIFRVTVPANKSLQIRYQTTR